MNKYYQLSKSDYIASVLSQRKHTIKTYQNLFIFPAKNARVRKDRDYHVDVTHTLQSFEYHYHD